MHHRKEILLNQHNFIDEITTYLREEHKQLKRELYDIETHDKKIKEEKSKLIKRTKNIKINKEIDKLFITERNIYPEYYAWWDDDIKEVIKYKYIQ